MDCPFNMLTTDLFVCTVQAASALRVPASGTARRLPSLLTATSGQPTPTSTMDTARYTSLKLWILPGIVNLNYGYYVWCSSPKLWILPGIAHCGYCQVYSPNQPGVNHLNNGYCQIYSPKLWIQPGLARLNGGYFQV